MERQRQTGQGALKNARPWIAIVLFSSVASAMTPAAQAGLFEFKFGYSYSRTNFSVSEYTWTRIWSLSLGYYITRISRIEISYANQYARSVFPTSQTSQIEDQYATLNWVQGLLPSTFPVQPYLKAGAGQLNRVADLASNSGVVTTIRQDALTFVLGAGLRVPVSQSLGVEAELKGYIINYDLSTWKDNLAIEGGVAFYF